MKYTSYILAALMLVPVGMFATVDVQAFDFDASEAEFIRGLDEANNGFDQEECWGNCGSKLKLLCALIKNLHARCVTARSINVSHNICAQGIKATNLQTDRLEVKERACFENLSTQDVCAHNIAANNLCLDGLATFKAIEVCQPFRATEIFSTNKPYTLGTIINFDTIADDPNGNVSLVPNTHYTVPKSGYYIITLQIDQFDLTTNDPVLGVPVANPQILVNGKVFRQLYTPFLAFHNLQRSTFSALASLKAGDEVTSSYNVLVMTDGGFTPLVGTVTIESNGSEEDSSVFKIHYLSSDCLELPCEPCTPSNCEPLNIECQTCAPCCA